MKKKIITQNMPLEKAAPGERGFHAAADQINDFEDVFRDAMEATVKFTAAWEVWYAERDRTANCPQHVDQIMILDKEASIARSWSERQNRVVFKLCRYCELAIKQARENAVMQRNGVPEDMLHCNFENWQVRGDADKATLARAKEYVEKLEGAFILIGKDWGVGKTHLAIACLRAALMKRMSVMFITHTAFVKEMRDGYDDPKARDIIENCQNVGFLVFDELGLGTGGRDEIPAIHLVLDTRKQNNSPFALTSNADTVDALEPLVGPRMMDRLREFAFDCRRLTGSSMRKRRFGA